MSKISITVDGVAHVVSSGIDGFGLFEDRKIVAQRVNG
ncbi:MAG: threonine--tRNA ligase, partial [Actinomycetota bacterium]